MTTVEYETGLENRLSHLPMGEMQMEDGSTPSSLLEGYIGTVGAGNVNHQYVDLLQRLDDFKAPYLEARCVGSGASESSEHFAEQFGEFKKYVALTQVNNKGYSIFSKEVDDLWHEFILFTKPYREFCSVVVGSFVDHSPYSPVG